MDDMPPDVFPDRAEELRAAVLSILEEEEIRAYMRRIVAARKNK